MNRKIIHGVVFLLSMGAVTSFADGLYIVPEVGYALPTESEVDDTLFLGGRIGSEITDNFALEVEAGYTEYKIDFSDRFQNVELQHVPVLLNLQYSLGGWQEGGFFVFAGAGFGFNEMENGIDDVLGVDDSVAWQAGIGYEVDLSDSTALVLDARYYRNDPDMDLLGTDEISLSTVMFNLGVKFGA